MASDVGMAAIAEDEDEAMTGGEVVTLASGAAETVTAADNEDVEMKPPAPVSSAPESMKQKISRAVWGVVKPVLVGIDCKYANQEEIPLLEIDGDAVRDQPNDPKLFRVIKTSMLSNFAEKEWEVLEDAMWDGFAAIVKAARDAIKERPATLTVAIPAKQQETAFTTTYIPGANDKFEQYLKRCCKEYLERPDFFLSPYVTIVQSSGFGKSRLLNELATKFNKNVTISSSDIALASVETEIRFDMRLLYVCAPSKHRSSRFPKSTPMLNSFFFDSTDGIAKQLERAFAYALENWDTVQDKWLALFDRTGKGDGEVATALNGVEDTSVLAVDNAQDGSVKRIQVLVLVVDEARALLANPEGREVSNFRLLRRALKVVNETLRVKGKMIFGVLVDTNSRIYDFTPPRETDPSFRNMNEKDDLMFPPFVLTQTMDSMLTVAKTTHNVDNYKSMVLRSVDDSKTAWEMLLSMGRPMWYAFFVLCKESNIEKHKAIWFAAAKLLCGLDLKYDRSYDAGNFMGVSSMMCRLGLRPQSSSAFASRAVADLMAVLHYVNYTNDGHFSGYMTEPLLAFAATHIWYVRPLPPEGRRSTDQTALQKYVLPQFSELLMQGLIDIGAIGEVVARIVLLLGMDSTIANDEMHRFAERDRYFSGQWCSVTKFLEALEGQDIASNDDNTRDKTGLKYHNHEILRTVDTSDQSGPNNKRRRATDEAKDSKKDPKIQRAKRATDATDEQMESLNRWKDSWSNWNVSFSHFVELNNLPTTDTLWFLLGRRAAGVLQCNQKGADLIIPIFHKADGKVSFILVQVKNRGYDNEFPGSAIDKLHPSFVFQDQQKSECDGKLCDFPARGMIRVYMSLRECNLIRPARSYLIDKFGSTGVEDESYTLCLRGMFGKWVDNLPTQALTKTPTPTQMQTPTQTQMQLQTLKYWPFLQSNELIEQLIDLANAALWDPEYKIDQDIKRRASKATGSLTKLMPSEEISESIRHTLGLIPYGKTSTSSSATSV